MKRTFISVFSIVLAISMSESVMGQAVVVAPLTDRHDAIFDFKNIQEGEIESKKKRVEREMEELKASGSSDYKAVLKMARIARKFEANEYRVSTDRFGVHAWPNADREATKVLDNLVDIDPRIALNSVIFIKYTNEARPHLKDVIDYVGKDVAWDEAYRDGPYRRIKLIGWGNVDIASFVDKVSQYDIGREIQVEEIFYRPSAMPLATKTTALLTANGKIDLAEVMHQIN